MRKWIKKNRALLLVASVLLGALSPVVGIPAAVASAASSAVSILVKDVEQGTPTDSVEGD